MPFLISRCNAECTVVELHSAMSLLLINSTKSGKILQYAQSAPSLYYVSSGSAQWK